MSTVSSTQITHHIEEGYCLIPNLIPRNSIEAARLRALKIGQQLAPWHGGHFQVLDPERYRSENDTPLPVGIQRPASQETVFADVADNPSLAEAMAALLGDPVKRFTEIRLASSTERSTKHREDAVTTTKIRTTGKSHLNWAATVGYPSPLWASMPVRWLSCRKRIRAGS